MHKLIILFGVSGSGKSTIGKKLSKDLKFKFIEGDDFHSINNINKMKRRLALNDNDREEWLQALNNKLKDQSINTVLACSALKEKYRKKLIRGLDINIFWFCLKGEFDLINQRLKKRNNHFFSSSLLQSQYDIIEYPDYCNFIDISESKNKIVELIKLKLLK
ncbi:gluconokinase, GntK/IdnK-type [Flavobacteriaceae bacterium]|jgi:carbohydrate kinase (thermoresistant glucokinase family)|nr:gluconate kinase [Flavobacteriaceae bacterium]MDC0034171.1 gluconokinase, GntK/IdnK-type [Flavobacteriaceae bacterium]|tara:strand:+ start:95 stop:580 length:486 start_codon:yes stop_codon:yes gene_type:complete